MRGDREREHEKDEATTMPQTPIAQRVSARLAIGERTLRPAIVGLGAVTVAFGIWPVLAPRVFAQIFQFPIPDTAIISMERSLGVRDVVMGTGILAVAARGGNYRSWLLARLTVDAGDTLAVALAVAQGYAPPRFLALGGLALGAALTESVLYWLAVRAK